MQLKILYTAALILCLSALASSHECSRHCPPGVPGKAGVKTSPAQAESDPAASGGENEETLEFPLLRVIYV